MNTKFNANGPLIWSIAALAVTAIVLLIPAWSLVMALLTPGTGDRDPANMVAIYIEQHDAQQDTSMARFNGRSVFFEPRMPPPPRPVIVQGPDPEPKPVIQLPDPINPIYTGPSIYAVIDGKVWFKDGKKLGVGEEESGLKVLSIDAPWGATVAYGPGEYDVPLFERFHFPAAPPSSGSTPGLTEVKIEEDPAVATGENEEDDAVASADPEADEDANNEQEESGEGTTFANAAPRGPEKPEPESAGTPDPNPAGPEK